jgi:hypothetical protein
MTTLLIHDVWNVCVDLMMLPLILAAECNRRCYRINLQVLDDLPLMLGLEMTSQLSGFADDSRVYYSTDSYCLVYTCKSLFVVHLHFFSCNLTIQCCINRLLYHQARCNSATANGRERPSDLTLPESPDSAFCQQRVWQRCQAVIVSSGGVKLF